jgi:amino acid permease
MKKEQNSRSNFKTIFFTLVTSTMGVVTLFMPKLLLETGIVLGIGMLMFSAWLCYVTCTYLTEASRKFNASSYTNLTKIILGRYAFIVDIFYVINLFGIILTNQTFVSKTLSGSIKRIFFSEVDDNSPVVLYIKLSVMLISNLVIIPFIISRNLTNLKKLSKFTLVGFSFALLTILATYLVPSFFGFQIEPINLEKFKMFNFSGLKITYGMYLLCMAIHLVVIDINYELRPGTFRQSQKLIFFNKLTCFCLYGCISVWGFLAIYQNPKIEKLNNYFIFFLVHQNLDHYILRTAHIVITLSILFSNIFYYIPLIKYFNSKVNDSAFKVENDPNGEQEGSIYEVISFNELI